MAASTPSFVDYLPREAIDWIAIHADKRGVPARGVLVSEGANAGDIFFVTAGAFEVMVADSRGGQQKISQLGRGAVIGEMSWLDGGPASATIEAIEASEVLAITGAALDAKIAADPVFGS